MHKGTFFNNMNKGYLNYKFSFILLYIINFKVDSSSDSVVSNWRCFISHNVQIRRL